MMDEGEQNRLPTEESREFAIREAPDAVIAARERFRKQQALLNDVIDASRRATEGLIPDLRTLREEMATKLDALLGIDRTLRDALRSAREATKSIAAEPWFPEMAQLQIRAGLSAELVERSFASISRAGLSAAIRPQLTGPQSGFGFGSSDSAIRAALGEATVGIPSPKEIAPILDSLAAFTSQLTSHGAEAFLKEHSGLQVAQSLRQSLSSTVEALTSEADDRFAEDYPVVAKFILEGSEKLDVLIRDVEHVKEQQDSEARRANNRWEATEASWRAQELDWAYQRILDLIFAILIAFLPQVVSLPPSMGSAKPSASSSPSEEFSSPPEDLDIWILETVQRLQPQDRYGQEVRALIREAPLRIEPHARAKELCRLAQDSSVLILEESGAWYFVKTLLSEHGQVVETGWVFRSHLVK